MSGRTGAYRTKILRRHDFLDGFKNEKWGKYILNADDDNFRYTVAGFPTMENMGSVRA